MKFEGLAPIENFVSLYEHISVSEGLCQHYCNMIRDAQQTFWVRKAVKAAQPHDFHMWPEPPGQSHFSELCQPDQPSNKTLLYVPQGISTPQANTTARAVHC
jgi:hypothetical protein